MPASCSFDARLVCSTSSGTRASTLIDAPENDEDWYANLIWIQRRKCLLLMHTATLFPLLAVNVSKRDLRDLGG